MCSERPYIARDPAGTAYYHPYQSRKRLDCGSGTPGDMGCHIFDPVFKALELTAPISIRSEGPAPDQWNWAINSRIRYIFAGTHTRRAQPSKSPGIRHERPPKEVQPIWR